MPDQGLLTVRRQINLDV